ncbi:SLATT domain-containing protein [Pseudoalteromonas sp. CNC9-20]|uniref:DUF4231 domain-containing protein n=1 Tax=Pseudoalteromonas sp. CNC9-20 TaxID=2917750 RepID=UPI001EF5B8B6|nr:SLATT domain-containing protein [Pseudoalteromonas sp. CNC9-20]MCG7569283.1 SLATT domain-containing protein [Pseudoalteromonas sp. CNC9-20]
MGAKQDVTAELLPDWDHYIASEPSRALADIYQRAGARSQDIRNWYWRSIQSKRRASLTVRILTFSLVILGALLPIFAGLFEHYQQRLYLTQAGVGALALAGLLQAADRIFGWSSGWIRYISTVTEMESLSRRFEADWSQFILHRHQPLQQDDVRALFDLSRHYLARTAQLQKSETRQWVSEFATGNELLGELIQQYQAPSQPSESISAPSTTQPGAQLGAVNVKVEFSHSPYCYAIAIDDAAPIRCCAQTWTQRHLALGAHIIKIYDEQGNEVLAQQTFYVSAAQIAELTIALPARST